MRFAVTNIKVFVTIFLILSAGTLFAQDNNVSNDWKMTTAGNIHMVIYNRGRIFTWETDYPGLIDIEYPPGSGEEHIGATGIMIGGIKPDGSIGITAGDMMKAPDEFWPTSSPWDTIWVVNRSEDPVDIGGLLSDDTPDIYRPAYRAISDQDFVCRYNDYFILNPTFGGPQYEPHNPLYIDVIQIVYSWQSPPLNDVVLYNYSIIPTKFDIRGFVFGFQFRPSIGREGSNPSTDDRMSYVPEYQMLLGEDGPGGPDGDAISYIGFQLFPPEDVPAEEITWTYIWGVGTDYMPDNDVEHYSEINTSGVIMRNQESFDSGICYLSMLLPGVVAVGDTVKVQVAIVLSTEGTEGILKNANTLAGLKSNNFIIPTAPPAPPVVVEEMNKSVKLSWMPTTELNPEIFRDDARLDDEEQPFEGYRIYKSTLSRTGPWTLLAEYDVANNEFGQNTGLFHEYLDIGLLNNVEYFYAITSFSKPDMVLNWPSMESSLYLSSVSIVPGTTAPKSVGEVTVVPNPYRADVNYRDYNPPWEKPPTGRNWMPQDRRIQFINLPGDCVIKIYTAAGDFVAEIQHENPDRGYEDWNLTSHVGQAIASGVYMFSVEDNSSGDVQIGKFVVIK